MTKTRTKRDGAAGGAGPRLRWHLRASTERTHQTLDDRLAALPLETLAGYRTFLEIVAPPTWALEMALDRTGAERLLTDWPMRRRSAAIAGDLNALGSTLPPVGASPDLATTGHAWGTLYVLEGARLGGMVLERRIANSADARVRSATRYLSHGRGERLWVSFLEELERSGAARSDVEAGAKQAFALFHRSADAVLSKEGWRSRQGSNLQPAD